MPLKLIQRGKVWHLQGTVAGQRIRESTGLVQRAQAEVARVRRETELIERQIYGSAATRTFAEAALAYLETGGEARFLGPILDHFGATTRVVDIKQSDIDRCAKSIYPGGAPGTINRQIITPISAVLRLHYQSEGKSPPVLRRRREPKGRIRWLSPEEAERLIEAAAALTLPRHSAPEPYTLAKIAFLLGTGCRTGECFAADVAHFHASAGQWWIPGLAPGAGKTASAARMVRLPARARALMGDLPADGAAFRTPYGKPIQPGMGSGGQMAAAFGRARAAAGLGADVTPHVLRHTWATWFYAQTRDFGALMDQGGWSGANTANRYRKIAPDDLGQRLLDHGWDFRIGTDLTQDRAETAAPAQIRMVK